MGAPRATTPKAFAVLAFALVCASTVLAHGDEQHGKSDGGMDMDTDMDMSADQHKDDYPPTYFSHSDHASLMIGHIACMTIAWAFMLPVAVMLSLVSSRYTLLTQLVFLATNALGLLLGTIYNAQTPDLYPGNAHHPIGWIITWVVSAHILVSLVGRVAGFIKGYKGARHQQTSTQEHQPFIPVSNGAEYDERQRRSSDDSAQASNHSAESMGSNSVSTHVADDEMGAEHHKEYTDEDQEFEDLPLVDSPIPSSNRLILKIAQAISQRIWRYIRLGYQIVDRIILPFGFVAFTTGIATYGRFFEGHAIFGGLAHWIKGGVFFWLGLFNLGRWSGSFAELGWAWNLRPRQSHQKWHPSSEFVESALIFFYGSTNIFLEHLGNSNGGWRAQDLEHVSITVLFIGGGLCGMLIESTWIRDLLSMSVSDLGSADGYTDLEREEELQPPTTYQISLNPIPALVIMLLGIMMSSHHQESMTSTMVHAQWGNLFLGASFARGLTYVIMYIKPPKSVFPSRPPTELLSSFGLIAGGIIFMASSSDTVDRMIRYELDAMFMYTVTMGLVGILMAWVLAVLAIKGWALRKERRASMHT
ncbi:Protein of unknown function (Ytp1) [Geosmithia morbida]|uniref:Integral membrane protein n=1 Tax=Geosmithia morbida TaxID=1094350 RepID=A0A9P5CZI0_9HYPO|nr:Protein of unknown function (Ytp1) [Geosmithia morbida]KAF4121593.1 Protein of unknown function (Ytp1) [Geosmithia morbida]